MWPAVERIVFGLSWVSMRCQQLKVQELRDFTKKSGFLKKKNPKMWCPGLSGGASERFRSITLSFPPAKRGVGWGLGSESGRGPRLSSFFPWCPRLMPFVTTDLTLNLPNKKNWEETDVHTKTCSRMFYSSFVHDCPNLEVIKLSLNR